MRVLLSLDDTKVPSTSAPQPPSSHPASGNTNPRHSFPSCRNVLLLLVRREVSSQTKQSSKRLGGGFSKVSCASLGPEVVHDPRRGLLSWVEAESLQHLSAKYCRLSPPPRSTIAAAFSPDGKMVASTHGDHTVKIIDYQTGSCLKVLSGHRRTPWVVRFHPYYPDILASGSLDHEVRLWDTNTADCIGSRDFYRPIASIAFHAHGELLAIASGHKLYMWRYNRRGETSSPNIVLKTRRSLRAVNFHPYAGPFLLTAEVNDLDLSDSSMALATTQGYLQYPPPTIYVTRPHSRACPSLVDELPVMSLPLLIWPSFSGDGEKIYLHHISGDADSSSMQPRVHPSSVRLLTYPTPSGQYELLLSPVEPNRSSLAQRETADGSLMNETDDMVPHSATGIRDNMNVQLADRSNQLSPFDNPTHSELPSSQGWLVEPIQAAHTLDPVHVLGHENTSAVGERMNEMDDTVPHSATGIRDNMNEQLADRSNQLLPFDNPTYLELPSSQGWLVEHIQAAHSLDPVHVLGHENTSAVGEMENLMGSTGIGQSQGVEVSTSRHHGSSLPHLGPAVAVGESDVLSNISRDESDPQHLVGRLQSDLAYSLAAAAELPCTVKLRIWSHDMKDPCAPLDPARCRLTIPYAVLCSEMGAHFSPCGRFLAACVACMLPNLEPDPGLQSHIHTDSTEAATSPTQHPISAHQVLYELRVYSLEEATFGSVLASRAIRAAHCLTSIQFSPTSEHLLLAYGRRHSSLLKSVVIDGGTTIPIYTVLEVYRVSDMELVRVLPSAEDEVNVACFHPSVGGGLVYGTKEGKLRILEYDNSHGMSSTASLSSDEHMLEV